MSSKPHTPGPWCTDKQDVFTNDRRAICEMDPAWHDTEQGDADARLIAAAPELLEALEEAKSIIRTWHGEEAWDIYDLASPEMKRINAAIAKARGE